MFQPDERVFGILKSLNGHSEGATVTLDVRVQCLGVDANNNSPLEQVAHAVVYIGKPPGKHTFAVSVKSCPYNTGNNGQYCKASHSDVDKIGEGVNCPYKFDLPYVDEDD